MLMNLIYTPLANHMVYEEGFVMGPEGGAKVFGPMWEVLVIRQCGPFKIKLGKKQIVIIRVGTMEALLVILIFNYGPMVKATGPVDWRCVHLAHIYRVISALSKIFNPVGLVRREPGFVTLYAVGVHILIGNNTVA
jgi:hypothetical protein